MCYAYILKSLKDLTYYYGSTENLPVRIKAHNAGRVKYTKGHRPYKLHYYETFPTRKKAMARERFFKTIEGYKWLRLNEIIDR